MATKKTTTKETAVVQKALVLKNPRITEKAANMGKFNIYVFDIAVGATKNEVAKAFAAKYKQTPLKVNTVNVKPKSYFRRGKLGFGRRSKKAYVAVPKGVTIDLM